MSQALRQPICVILGHIDHGKTTLLDKIRGTAVASREVGGITQHIGASHIPFNVLVDVCGPLLEKIKADIKIPGLLFIDTPGHEVFTNLRARGSSVADIAILVIDIIKGPEVQTYECVNLLKARKTPFIIAANKIDLIHGWKPYENELFIDSFRKQDKFVRTELDRKIYEIVGIFSRLGLNAERFDRVKDFTKNIAIVPVSAKTGEGIPELLAVLAGLTQQYMQSRLRVSEGSAKGVVLEVKEEVGLGVTVNAIIYEGVLKTGSAIVLGGKQGVIKTRIRSLLMPKPLDEIRDPRDKFIQVGEVRAAAGVKIVAPSLEDAMPGAPIFSISSEEELKKSVSTISEEISKIRVYDVSKTGVVLKSDTLGSLEAIINELKKHNIPVRLADVGHVCKRDVIEASVVRKSSEFYGVILAFNVNILPDAEEEIKKNEIPVFRDVIIYRIIEEYTNWLKEMKTRQIKADFESLIKPGKIRVLPGYVFRRSKPAIFGVEVLSGRIRPKYTLMREDGKIVGNILQIQDRGRSISEAKSGMRVAISMNEPIIGRHIDEGSVLYVRVPDSHVRALLDKYQDLLMKDEIETLNKITNIMRKSTFQS